MSDFFDDKIEVEISERFPRPVRFTWRGETHEVAEIISEHVDVGFGMLPPRSRKFFTRRHRRYFTVLDLGGQTFEIYEDYSDRKNRTWWLIKRRINKGADDGAKSDRDS